MADYAAELAAVEKQIADTRKEIAQLEYQRDTLGSRKDEIVAQCTALGIEPKIAAVEKAIQEAQASLDAQMSELTRVLA